MHRKQKTSLGYIHEYKHHIHIITAPSPNAPVFSLGSLFILSQIEVRKGHVSQKTHSNSWKFIGSAEVACIQSWQKSQPTNLPVTPEIKVVIRPPIKGNPSFFERLGWLNGAMNPRLAFCMTTGHAGHAWPKEAPTLEGQNHASRMQH